MANGLWHMWTKASRTVLLIRRFSAIWATVTVNSRMSHDELVGDVASGHVGGDRPTLADVAYDSLLRELMDRHPKSSELLFELDALVGVRLGEGEARASHRD